MRALFYILLSIVTVTQVGRNDIVSAYFDTHKQLIFEGSTGDWHAPELIIHKKDADGTVPVNELVDNGNFTADLDEWSATGSVTVAEDNTVPFSLSTHAAHFNNTGNTVTSLSQTLPAHDDLTVQFFFKLESTEEIPEFLEGIFQVVVDNRVIFTNTGTRAHDWQDIRVAIPASQDSTELSFEFAGLTETALPTTLRITNITTTSVIVANQESVIFDSNEPNSTGCFFMMWQTEPYLCQVLPYELALSHDESRLLKVTVVDPAGLSVTKHIGVARDTTAPQTAVIEKAYREENGDISLVVNSPDEHDGSVQLEVSFAAGPNEGYTWQQSMHDWIDTDQRTSSILFRAASIKIVKEVDSSQLWVKVRLRDVAGNVSSESEAVMIDTI